MNRVALYPNLCRCLMLCLGIVLLGATPIHAQKEALDKTEKPCEKLLDTLQSDFKNGHLRSLLVTAQSQEECVHTLTPEDKVKYYAIMAKTQLFLGQKPIADSLTIELLKVNPYYIAPSDDADLVYLTKQFDVHPLVSIGFTTGLNFSRAHATQDYTLGGSRDRDESYKGAANYRLGLSLQIPLPVYNYKLSISTGLLLNALSYQYSNTLRTASINGSPLDYSGISFRENQVWLRVPVLMHYHFPCYKKFRAYAEAGVGGDFLMEAKLRKLERVPIGSETSLSTEVANLQSINAPLRTVSHLSFIGGVGVQREIGKLRASVGLQYSYILGNMVRTENRYRDNSLLYVYNHIDDDFNMAGLTLCVSVQYHFFSQKRKRENSIAENKLEEEARKQLDELGDAVGGDLKKDIEEQKKALEADKKALEDMAKGKKDEMYDKVKARKDKAKAKLKAKINKPWD